MVVSMISRTVTKVFGSRNERLVKTYLKRVAQINELEREAAGLTDTALRAKTEGFGQAVREGQRIGQILPEAMAVARQVMDRAVGIRNVFNPEHDFDPTRLPADVQPLYHDARSKMEATPPEPVLGGGDEPVPGWMLVEIPNPVYEAVRELYPQSRPPFRARPFDVQLIGGMVLWEGKIAEMKTGEGKTIVAPLACYLAALEKLKCYVVTVNDYLVQRDRDWVFPFYHWLGMTVGAIHPFHMQPDAQKQAAYRCHVVYGTNSEFGFDYLRDNMKLDMEQQVQKQRDFCIIDEVDSILIDEARTPLIISGPAHDDAPRYDLADQVARHLIQKQRPWDGANEKVQSNLMRISGLEGDIRNVADKGKVPALREEMDQLKEQVLQLEADRDQHVQYYEVERDKKASHLTHEGVAEAQKVAGIGSFYVGNNMDFPHLLENALRAHAVYQRDRDYVVQNGEVIIVDEFTGRLMIGRQWSDGLHQAVEAKERVKIKQETQTLATVTIQNYFKLFERLAGMTGTALTEATEFHSVYKLDVVAIPTNVSVTRNDRDDLIFLSQKDKWNAILDEIKSKHDVGRPVLVGTTSVENSEMLSQMLAKRHSIQHEVLNAKQHEREAHIVEHAGELGAVMIATNMAGRGTDIKLAPLDRKALVRHWQSRDLLPRQASEQMSDEELTKLAFRHMAAVNLEATAKEVNELSDDEVSLRLLRHWIATETYTEPDKAAVLSEQRCLELLDKTPDFTLHRLKPYGHVEEMGGLHIVGTERHEARRIDNQLRGRAGRQGDHGSSRFFIALEDDLMKMFAGKTTLAALSKLGWKEGEAIEHRWITKSVERAQRKVEERNYEIRKNLLEYDETMEYQRNHFYGIRQEVLKGRRVDQIVFDYIGESIEDAVENFLDGDYVPTQVAEWCRQNLDVSVEPTRLRTDDLTEMEVSIRKAARDEARQAIDVTLGEYMSSDLSPEEWDLRGLSSWAMSRFSVDLKQNQLRRMSPEDVKTQLTESAIEQLDRKELAGLDKFLIPNYAQGQLVDWAKVKFDIDLDAEQLAGVDKDKSNELILQRAQEAYRRREVEYPVQFVLDMVYQAAQQDGQWAAEQLAGWANQRFDMGWTAEDVARYSGSELYEQLMKVSQQWHENGRLDALVDDALAQREPEGAQALADWAENRFGQSVEVEELANLDDEGRRQLLIEKGQAMLRTELTQLERFVLLQILDTAWKDHLYAMDQLKDSVGLRGYAEKDPRTEYKGEGANLYRQMQATVRDRVTDLIFRAKLSANMEQRSVYGQQDARHDEATSAFRGGAAAAAARGSTEQQADMEAAQRAGDGGDERRMTRRQRRAAAANQGREESPSPQAAANRPRYKSRKRKRR